MRAILACLMLAACGTTQSAPAAPMFSVACPPLTTYTPAQEADLAAALIMLDQANPLVQAMTDYGKLRAADRACLGLSTN
jgi:hypothetical protein